MLDIRNKLLGSVDYFSFWTSIHKLEMILEKSLWNLRQMTRDESRPIAVVNSITEPDFPAISASHHRDVIKCVVAFMILFFPAMM
jgi:hypothetical protein